MKNKSTRKKTGQTPGQGLPEYALTLALITLFCIGALVTLGNGIAFRFDDLSAYVSGTVMPMLGG